MMQISDFTMLSPYYPNDYSWAVEYYAEITCKTSSFLGLFSKIERRKIFLGRFEIEWIFIDSGENVPYYPLKKLYKAWEAQQKLKMLEK